MTVNLIPYIGTGFGLTFLAGLKNASFSPMCLNKKPGNISFTNFKVVINVPKKN